MKALEEKIAAVQQAEHDCARQRAEAHAAWHHMHAEIRRTATPVRIVVSGLALGFASGAATSGVAAAANGKLISGPIFSMLMDTVVPGLLAGITAAATASGEVQEAAGEAVEEAIDEGQAEPAEEAAPAKPRRKRKPRGPRRERADA
ncbi:MAG: hypothetical protein NT046_12140 [Arenimonas sp.]|nr:hypothetical protein [Arenimonas sp.]